MASDESTWKRCSTCKRPIEFRAAYFACSVSTCNRKGTDFAFCSVACWDAHVPVLRHRDAWADEKTAPSAAEHARAQQHQPPPAAMRPVAPAAAVRSATPAAVAARSATPAPQASSGGDRDHGAASGGVPRDVLVVVSKLKQYVRLTSGMNTSDDVIEPLSDRLRTLCDDAVERARADGRRTVMARDFRRPS